jgi:hypothetical protein
MGDEDDATELSAGPSVVRVVLGALGAAAVVVFVPLLADHRFEWRNTIGLGAILTVWNHRPYVRAWPRRHRK